MHEKPGRQINDVHARPELVFAIAFNERKDIHTTPRAPRFVRLERNRPAKSAMQVDTADTVRALVARQIS